MTWVNAFKSWFCGLSMRRVRTKLTSDKMSQRTKRVRGSGQLLRGVFKHNDRVTDGNWHDSRYLPAFAACHRADSL